MPLTTDEDIRAALSSAKVIALVGASMKPERPSNYVGEFLRQKGHRVIPVNPGHAGKTLFGETVHASLSEIEADVDMIDIFRQSDAVPGIVQEALSRFPKLQTIWMQLDITHSEAAKEARARGVRVIEDRCPKIEYPRLMDV
ncbi:CoA-binding protein [Epibacterium ulvae]|uniref:CoA-binding protein n=1 Tax=Epibacterium ulvae TaxID=1156985 RepID=UPI001BFC8001|nr:CoA-binding protein [Epibacterium ulvae]MBT8153758.1 CoA-binding protein [Epibacterium ulvae]